MSKDTQLLNYEDPDANMYGCLPCPRCKSKFRWPRGELTDRPLEIVCDECALVEPGVRST